MSPKSYLEKSGYDRIGTPRGALPMKNSASEVILINHKEV